MNDPLAIAPEEDIFAEAEPAEQPLSRPTIDPDALPLPASPFRGILPFRLLDWRIFRERQRETEKLEDLLLMYRAVLLYGRSGCGKSSLLNAGIMPWALRRNMAPERIRLLPNPGHEIAVERISLRDQAAIRVPDDGASEEASLPAFLPSRFARADADDRTVLSCEAFLERLQAHSSLGEPLLLFDQFEELVTLSEQAVLQDLAAEAQAARAAVETMLETLLLREQRPLKIIFAFRDDYFARLTPLFERVPHLLDQSVRIESPPLDRVGDIVLGPFSSAAGMQHLERERPPLTPALAARIEEGFRKLSPRGTVPLSELQTLCLTLWEKAEARAEFERAPDPAEMIRKILEREAWDKLKGFRLFDRIHAIALLSNLVTDEGTRNVIAGETLLKQVRRDPTLWAYAANTKNVLARLAKDTGLIRASAISGTDYYELTSEFLIPWVQNARRSLARMRKLFTVYASLAVAVFIGLLGWLLWNTAKAEAQAEKMAQENARLVEWNERLLAESRDKARADAEAQAALEQALREVSLKLQASAAPAAEPLSTPTQQLVTAQVAIQEANVGSTALRPIDLPHQGAVWKAVFSADGGNIATASADTYVRFWRLDGQPVIEPWKASTSKGGVTDVAVDPHGRLLISGSAGRSVRAYDLARRAPIANVPEAQADTITAVRFSANGDLALSASADKTVLLWPLQPLRGGARRIAPLATWQHNGIVTAANFNSDGKYVISSADDGFLRIWSTTSPGEAAKSWFANAPVRNGVFSPRAASTDFLATAGRDLLVGQIATDGTLQLRRLTMPHAPVHAVFSPDGEHIAVATADGVVTLLAFNNPSTDPIALERQQQGRVLRLSWSSLGMLALGAEDGTVQLWHNPTSDLRTTTKFQAHKGPVWWVLFSPDGRHLVTTSAFSDENLPTARGAAGASGKALSRLSDNFARLWTMP
jgi:WD40 repeat protein